jgi:hypothetical protein
MASILGEWDPAAAVPTLGELTRICRERYARSDNGHDWTNQNLAASIARFTLARDKGGDNEAIREYSEWIRTVSPDWLGHNLLSVLEPLYRRPDDPNLAAAAARLFGDRQSPWMPLFSLKGPQRSFRVGELISSPLIKIPAFRNKLLAGLLDRTPIGKAELRANRMVHVQTEGGLAMDRTAPGDDPNAAAEGVAVPIRTCDVYAWLLVTLEGAPVFNPCWSESRRDAAIVALTDFLKTNWARP